MLTDLYRKQWRETVAALDRARTPVDPTNFRSLGQAEPWTANPEKNALIQQRDSAVTKAKEAKQNADDLSTKLADVTEEKRVLEREKVDLGGQLGKYRKLALDDRATIDRLTEEREHEKKANELLIEQLESRIAQANWRIRLFQRFTPISGLKRVAGCLRLGEEPPLRSDSESDEDESSDEDEDEVDNNLTNELQKQSTEVAGPQPEHQQDRGQEQVGESAAGASAPALGQTNTVTMGGTEEAELLEQKKPTKEKKKKKTTKEGKSRKDLASSIRARRRHL